MQEAAPVCSVIEFTGHLVQIVTEPSRYVPSLQSTEMLLHKFSFIVIKMCDRYVHFLYYETAWVSCKQSL